MGSRWAQKNTEKKEITHTKKRRKWAHAKNSPFSKNERPKEKKTVDTPTVFLIKKKSPIFAISLPITHTHNKKKVIRWIVRSYLNIRQSNGSLAEWLRVFLTN